MAQPTDNDHLATVASRQRGWRNHFAPGRSRRLHDYSRPDHFRHAATTSTATAGRGVPRTRNGSRSLLANPRRTGRDQALNPRRADAGTANRGPSWCRPPSLRLLPFAWPDKIRLDGEGLYHPAYDSEGRYCPHCNPKYADWAGVPVDPAVVPRTARCPENNRLWPNTAARPWHGPIPEFWTRPGKVPRWHVWWRLWGVQEGRCATCPGRLRSSTTTTPPASCAVCCATTATPRRRRVPSISLCTGTPESAGTTGTGTAHPEPRSAGTGPTRSAKAASNRSCHSRQPGRLMRRH